MRDRITTIIEHWFIQEPALFQILCTHELAVNTQMACPIRSGKRRIEYNPDYLKQMTDQGLEEAFSGEGVRYVRQAGQADDPLLGLACPLHEEGQV